MNHAEQFLARYNEFSQLLKDGKIFVREDGSVYAKNEKYLLSVDVENESLFIKSSPDVSYVPREVRKSGKPHDRIIQNNDSSIFIVTKGDSKTLSGHTTLVFVSKGTSNDQPSYHHYDLHMNHSNRTAHYILGYEGRLEKNTTDKYRGFQNIISIPCAHEQSEILRTDLELDLMQKQQFHPANIIGKNCTGYITKKLEDVNIDFISLLGISHSMSERPIRPASINHAIDRMAGSKKKLAELYIEGLDLDSIIEFYEVPINKSNDKVILIQGGDSLSQVIYIGEQDRTRGLRIDDRFIFRKLGEIGLCINGGELRYKASQDSRSAVLDGIKILKLAIKPTQKDFEVQDLRDGEIFWLLDETEQPSSYRGR